MMQYTTTHRFLVSALTACLVLLGGCGSPSDDSDRSTNSLDAAGSSGAADAGHDAETEVDLCAINPPDFECRSLTLDECEAAGCIILDDGAVEYDPERDCVTERPFQRCEAPCRGAIQTDGICTHPDDGGCFLVSQMCSLHPELISLRPDEASIKCRNNIETAPMCPE